MRYRKIRSKPFTISTAVILRCSPRSDEPRRIEPSAGGTSFETPRQSAAPQDDGGE
jgi:hypothetical protein